MTAPSGSNEAAGRSIPPDVFATQCPGKLQCPGSSDANRSVRHRNETRVATLIGAVEVKSGTLEGVNAKARARDIDAA